MNRTTEWLEKQREKSVKGATATAEKWKSIVSQYNLQPNRCQICGQPLRYESRKKSFCSSRCAAKSRTGTKMETSTRSKISQSLKRRRSHLKVVTSTCIECGTVFVIPRKVGPNGKMRLSRRRTCSDHCLHLVSVKIGERAGKISASKSSVKRSKNEVMFFELCKSIQPSVSSEFSINGWDADIAFVDEKVAVFWNGIWHYKQLPVHNHHLRQVQNRDKIKKELYESSGWKVYVIQDMGKRNPTFVSRQFDVFKEWWARRDLNPECLSAERL